MAGLAWQMQECDRQSDRGVRSGEEIKFNDRLYKGQKDEVYINQENEAPFHGKCAYCEQIITGDQHGDIEHYRPKGAVKDADNKEVLVTMNGKDRDHPGYYWLAYDWKNLLPSCVRCNQLNRTMNGERIGKGNRFPVEGDHACSPGDEDCEKPMLLHPVFDDPEEHLQLDDTGLLLPMTERGRATVQILGLNERNLPESRKRKIEDVLGTYAQLAQDLILRRQDVLVETRKERIKEIKSGRTEFAMAGRRALGQARADVRDFP